MCQDRDSVQVRVRIPAELSHTGRSYTRHIGIDACIAPLVRALQNAGIDMRASCCGHGNADGRIDLQDGRTLVITRRQTMNGSLYGRVVDDQGAVLPGVTVKVYDLATEACRLLTDDCGMFQSPGLKPGTYGVHFLLSGMIPTWRAEITVAPGERIWAGDVVLKPSGAVGHGQRFPPDGVRRDSAFDLHLRPEVLAFAQLMEAKLRAHDADRGATGWKTATPWDLWRWLEREVGELRLADRNGDLAAIGREAADVANFAMMLADVRGALSPLVDAGEERKHV